MHLLTPQAGTIDDGTEPVDLRQDPADIVVLSAADTEIAGLARARAALGTGPGLRLASLLHLGHPMSVDLYLERTLARARLIVLRLIGGAGYWRYGTDEVVRLARGEGLKLAVLSGTQEFDPGLGRLSTIPEADQRRLFGYLSEGGPENFRNALLFMGSLLGEEAGVLPPPARLPKAGLLSGREPRHDSNPVEPASPLPTSPSPLPTSASPLSTFPSLLSTSPGLTGGPISPPAPWLPKETRRSNPVGSHAENDDRPVAAVVFYRALVQADDLAPVEALCDALEARGLQPLPMFVSSLKDAEAAGFVETTLAEAAPAVVVNATAFAASKGTTEGTPLDRTGIPVLQVAFAGMDEATWEASPRGLAPRDLAMHVALPEVDGRIFARAVSFKGETRFDPETQTAIVAHRPRPDRIAFAADLAAAWAQLGRKPRKERRIAIVLANASGAESRIGHAVGLDAPESAVGLLRALATEGYDVHGVPASGDDLVDRLGRSATRGDEENRGPAQARASQPSTHPPTVMPGLVPGIHATVPPGEMDCRDKPGNDASCQLSLKSYRKFVDRISHTQKGVLESFWGDDVADSFFSPAANSFEIPALRFGNVAVAVQPARGAGDSRSSQHDPTIPPPHGLIATYLWIRETFAADAVIHLGKHGVLEWLPGKALALSAECWPEILLGSLPNLYPFIVNDPGEGAQAKRRSAAVIVDHLIPPLRRAEVSGPLKDLESLADEYAEAAALDPRRVPMLADRIMDRARVLGLDRELGLPEDRDAALQRLDAFLCDVKDLAIRDGLHVFGQAPEDEALSHLLLALVRAPRGDGIGENASLLRALADDLGLGFDPLTEDAASPWTGPRPDALAAVSDAPWRLTSHTCERLDAYALALLDGRAKVTENSPVAPVLRFAAGRLRPLLRTSAKREIGSVLAALDGRFIPPGPSGAPTRGRLDVLPTGRNFYSVDSRSLPTEAAWDLGRRAAEETVTAHLQEHGRWPRRIALSAWGTSAMRTGGDDVAQVFALIGARPVRDSFSGRVNGFEILSLPELKRPRIDVVLRVSGFFRDAFPTQIDLLASAFAAVAGRDEPVDSNPLREEPDAARIFSSAPGAYGTGLADLIASGAWETRKDLARAFLAASGYAYGAGAEGTPDAEALTRLVGETDVVLQAQDAREFDVLDAPDFFEFEGGLAAAVEAVSGVRPAVYHADTSLPERPRTRRLEEEIARVVRGRAANPRWIAGVKRHGHRGGGEMAQTMEALFAFAAVTGRVPGSLFETLHAAWIEDEDTRRFLEEKNPAALREIAGRFTEAIDRGLWTPRRNSLRMDLDALRERTQSS